MFLLKPHVTGAEGQVTSPDVIVDRLIVDGTPRPLSLLTHDAWHETDDTAVAGYGIMALGGGALILPALVFSGGLVVASRSAWRLHNLDDRIGSVTLNGVELDKVGLPCDLIAAAGGSGDALPRGFLLVRSMEGTTSDAKLADPATGRALELNLHVTRLDSDRWGDARPRPRYSVGPTQKEVQHFI